MKATPPGRPFAAAFLALLLGGAMTVLADATNEPPRSREDWKKLSPAEREARAKDWEKRRESWNKLSTGEREAKRKEIMERLDKRLTELRQKQTNSTISTNELRELERCDHLKKRFNERDKTQRPKTSEPPGPPGGDSK
jgi:hypothetical protein